MDFFEFKFDEDKEPFVSGTLERNFALHNDTWPWIQVYLYSLDLGFFLNYLYDSKKTFQGVWVGLVASMMHLWGEAFLPYSQKCRSSHNYPTAYLLHFGHVGHSQDTFQEVLPFFGYDKLFEREDKNTLNIREACSGQIFDSQCTLSYTDPDIRTSTVFHIHEKILISASMWLGKLGIGT